MKRIFTSLLILFSLNSYASEYQQVAVADGYITKEIIEVPAPEFRYEIVVNRSNFTADIFDDGDFVEQRRVILGAKGWQTPLFDGEIQYVRLNPQWNVPKGIRFKVVSKLKGKKDALGYINRNGYYFLDSEGGRLDPSTFDWATIPVHGPYPFVDIKQNPGKANVLGDIMFVIKNSKGVQLHGTSNPELFDKEVRRFSSGCIRIENVNSLAAMALELDQPAFESLLKNENDSWKHLPQPIRIRVID